MPLPASAGHVVGSCSELLLRDLALLTTVSPLQRAQPSIRPGEPLMLHPGGEVSLELCSETALTKGLARSVLTEWLGSIRWNCIWV